ncbi:MAG: hypothetical protein II089_11870 [Selenomonas sp.]|jgi:hypothetical protein|nr:hypothetical protein [Selenomonas sp.]
MTKKFMNKMDNMALDKVSGGRITLTPKLDNSGKIGNAIENKIKKGVKEIKEFFDFLKPKWTQPGKLKNNIIA